VSPKNPFGKTDSRPWLVKEVDVENLDESLVRMLPTLKTSVKQFWDSIDALIMKFHVDALEKLHLAVALRTYAINYFEHTLDSMDLHYHIWYEGPEFACATSNVTPKERSVDEYLAEIQSVH
jgi:hypothetical protein